MGSRSIVGRVLLVGEALQAASWFVLSLSL